MADTKIIAVLGATGGQGGGVARAILDDPEGGFACRAVTRNPASDAARSLADRGAEVVQAELDDTDSLARAFAGAHGAYCMTNFFEHFTGDTEVSQAANLAQAAKAVGVRHAIWSTMPDSRDWVALDDDRLPTLQGRYKVPNWDAKAEGDHFFSDAGVPTTFLHLPMFWDNFVRPGSPQQPRRGPDGVLAISFPTGGKALPGIAAEDIGRCAYGIFKAAEQFTSQTVGVAAEYLTGERLASELSKDLGEQVRYNDVPVAALRASGFPGADLVANMCQVTEENYEAYCGLYDVAVSRLLNPQLQTLEQWLTGNRAAYPVPAGTASEESR